MGGRTDGRAGIIIFPFLLSSFIISGGVLGVLERKGGAHYPWDSRHLHAAVDMCVSWRPPNGQTDGRTDGWTDGRTENSDTKP